MQRATVNLFADMGNVQPATLMDGLTPATQMTDTSPPTTTITSPSLGATFRTVRPLLLTESGWQEVDFSQPVTIDANTTYIASYFAPNGHYSANSAYFYTTPPMGTNPTITTVNSPPLQTPRNTNGTVNGFYSYSGTPTFPTSTFNAANYRVDPIFSPLKRRSGNRTAS